MINSIFKDIGQHEKSSTVVRGFFINSFQKWTLICSGGLYLLLVLLALSTLIFAQGWLELIAIVLMFSCMLSAILSLVPTIADIIKVLRKPFKSFLDSATSVASEDYQLATLLSKYDEDQLSYVKRTAIIRK